MAEQFVALITGYTGESGKALLKQLLQSNQIRKIILIGRRSVDLSDQQNNEKTVKISIRVTHLISSPLNRNDVRQVHRIFADRTRKS